MSTRDKSSQQEKFLSKQLNARVVANSGASFRKKGDLHDDFTIYEAKTVMKPQSQHTIKKSWLEELEGDRRRERKQFSALVFDFGTPTPSETLVALPLQQFLEMYNFYKEEHE